MSRGAGSDRRSVGVSIDVDAVRHYHAIHGLPPPQRDPVLHTALPRLLSLCESLSIPVTLFVVGADLDHDDDYAAFIANAAARGHEIASHSHAHRYDLSRLGRPRIDDDLQQSVAAIARVTGRAPRGFRAPGYNLSEDLVDALVDHGFAYDSSLMPSPAYFSLRAAAVLKHRLSGRVSSSMVGSLKEFTAPARPFFADVRDRARPAAHNKARAILSLPITPVLGAFWIGTTQVLLPDLVGQALTRQALRTPGPIVFELHAIDLAGPDDGFHEELVAHQLDLRVALSVKERRLRQTLATLVNARQARTLADIAATVAPA